MHLLPHSGSSIWFSLSNYFTDVDIERLTGLECQANGILDTKELGISGAIYNHIQPVFVSNICSGGPLIVGQLNRAATCSALDLDHNLFAVWSVVKGGVKGYQWGGAKGSQ
jgi:hypothetical protein